MKTITDLLAEHIEHLRSLNGSPFTLRTTHYHGQAFADWLEKNYQVRTVDRLRSDHLHAWQKHLAAHRTDKGLPLKAKSINRLVTTIRVFLDYLCQKGLLQNSMLHALAYVKEPRLLPTSVLNHGQVKKVLLKIQISNPRGYRNRTMLELLYSTGIRARELLGLNLADVDFENATAMVMGKGSKQRVVPIGKTALRMLESYVKAIRPFLVKTSGETALFLNSKGARLPYHTFWRILNLHTKSVGLEIKVSAHTFRRSCTTELIRGGANLYHVKDLLGHESLDTLKHYAKLTIEDLKKTHAKCHPRERSEEG